MSVAIQLTLFESTRRRGLAIEINNEVSDAIPFRWGNLRNVSSITMSYNGSDYNYSYNERRNSYDIHTADNNNSNPWKEATNRSGLYRISTNRTSPVTCHSHCTCAIMFFGLPRSFKSLVLPSIVRNIVKPNLQYHCDYYVHYYNTSFENPGRSSVAGGPVNPQEIFLLNNAIRQVTNEYNIRQSSLSSNYSITPTPHIAFAETSDDEFYRQYSDLVTNYTNATDNATGQPLYIPQYESGVVIENIIKMWHSQHTVWNLAMDHTIQYDRVAMLRSDVVFMNPVDVWSTGKYEYNHTSNKMQERKLTPRKPILDINNTHVVIPAFAAQPVNDRAIIGPTAAVKYWATERWNLIDYHVNDVVPALVPGKGMSSERFLAFSLFPTMLHEVPSISEIVEDPYWCFARARVQSLVWILDCAYAFGSVSNARQVLENVLNRTCGDILIFPDAKEYGRQQIRCPEDNNVQ
jgi:hypothetical protein